MDYYDYKRKYFILKEQYGGNKNGYYFVHGTKNLSNIYSILKDGVIKIGKDVKTKNRMLCGESESSYIYLNIYFDDIKNILGFFDYTLILHPKIMEKYDIRFLKGWGDNECNGISVIKKNINKIKKFVENPELLGEAIKNFSGILHHECIVSKPINIKKYLIGVVCNNISQKDKDILLKNLSKYNYPNVKILDNNLPKPLSFFI